MTTVARGFNLGLVWTFAGDLTTPLLTITPVGSGTPTVGPTSTGLAACGSGRYTYVWSPASDLTIGQYTAVVAGTLAGEATSSSTTVTVTGLPTYATLVNLKSHLRITDTDRDAELTRKLTAGARMVDAYCGRRFYADASATARVYRTARRIIEDDDGELLLVEDISSTTGLVVQVGDGTTWSTIAAGAAGYWTEPENAIANLKPITGLRYDLAAWSTYRRARITAPWGWPAIDDRVVEANTLWSARLFRRKESPDGTAGEADTQFTRVRPDADIRELLDEFVLPGVG